MPVYQTDEGYFFSVLNRRPRLGRQTERAVKAEGVSDDTLARTVFLRTFDSLTMIPHNNWRGYQFSPVKAESTLFRHSCFSRGCTGGGFYSIGREEREGSNAFTHRGLTCRLIGYFVPGEVRGV